MEKRKRTMVEVSPFAIPRFFGLFAATNDCPKSLETVLQALQAREEEAKRAKLDSARRHAEASAEADVQEQGRKMREQAAMAVETARLQAIEEEKQRLRELNAPSGLNGSGLGSRSATNGQDVVEITSLDLTLMIQFPAGEEQSIASSADTFRSALSARYGPLENIDLLPQAGPSTTKPDDVKSAKKQKKPKGPRWAVEFKRSNRDGCWACWKDHLEAEGKSARPLVKGLKVKFAGKKDGESPAWVARSSAGNNNGHPPMDQSIPPIASKPNATPAAPPISNAFASSFSPSTFPTVPSSFPTPESKRKQQEIERERAAVDDFESGILFRMRQQEREKLEQEIRRQEAEEA